jgi:tryptophan synthase beta chain
MKHLSTILPAGAHILVNLSGRGDKDMETAGKYFGLLGDK